LKIGGVNIKILKFKIGKHNLIMFAMFLFGFSAIFSYGILDVSAASPIYVSTLGNNSWNGQNSSWINGTLNGPKATIKNATGTVSSGGTVYIAKGTYNENNITINKNMTIVGSGQDNTIINGTNANTIFIIRALNITISNLTITNGKNTINTANRYGGAIDNINAKLTITGSTFTGNTSPYGAIYNKGTLNITDSTFIDNTANKNGGDGGAIYNSMNSSLTVNNSTFTGNTAYLGGAIYNSNTAYVGSLISNDVGNLTVKNSRFTDNTAKVSGGAIFNEGNSTLTGSIFIGNKATTNMYNDGGAIGNGGDLTVNKCTFTINTADVNGIGGAIINYSDSDLTVNKSTFTGNTAKGDGGAIYNEGALNVNNCIFTENKATTDGGAIINSEGTMNVTDSNFTNNTAKGDGGAINNFGNANLHFNQIVGNTAQAGNAIYNQGFFKVNATLNWWGYNLGVNIAKQIVNTHEGNITYNPWIILTITASPTSVYVGGNSTITAELLYSSNGVYHNPKYGGVPYTGYTDFKTNKGIIKNVKFVNGKAISTLTNLTIAGVASVSATVDNATVITKVTIQLRPIKQIHV
jgi:autotransporter family porin